LAIFSFSSVVSSFFSGSGAGFGSSLFTSSSFPSSGFGAAFLALGFASVSAAIF